jgi:hypothetical protein
MLEEVIKSYKTVIADVLADDTWLPKPKEKVLSLLRTRLTELETVWSIPDELWNAKFDEVELPDPEQPDGNEDPDHCSSCNGVGENRYEVRCEFCFGTGRNLD